MKNATLLRVGQESVAARWFGLLAIAALLPLAASLKAQTPTITETTVTTLGGGPQYYNPGHSFGYSNSVYGVLESQFHTPLGIAFDGAQDYLYVADRDNNAIRLIDSVGEIFTFAPDPPYVPANLISQPVGVAVDALSDVFILNRGNGANGTVVEFDYLGNLLATNMTKLTNASGIALDTIGDIYVTTRNTVFKITPAGVSNVVVTITNAGTSLQGIVVKRSGPSAGWLAVCDSGRNGIYLINPASGAVTTNAGFNGAGDGTGNRNQGVFNASARFFQPSGLAEAGDGSLIVTDFGNHRVKVVTVAGLTTNLYGVASNVWWTGTTPTGGTALKGWSDGAVWEPDGGLGNVQARMPFGVAIGPDGTIYTTEDYYHIIRQVTGANIQPPPLPPPPPPPPPAPVIGIVSFPPPDYLSLLTPVTSFVFNNDVIIAIAGTNGTVTLYTSGATGTVPSPSTNSSTAPFYQDELPSVSDLGATRFPDMTIKAITVNGDGASSQETSARFQFIVANPTISGNNAAQFTVSDITAGAQFLYTTDGTDPRTNGTPGTNGINGTTLSLPFPAYTNLMLFQIVAWKAHYQTSSVVSQVFSISNFVPNTISFGFASGEPSSKFMARPGQFYYAPVTLEMLPGFGKMYSLQFNVTVTNGLANTNKIVNGAGIDFFPMLMTQVTPEEGQYYPPADGNWYLPIPAVIIGSGTNISVPVPSKFVNTNNNLLGIGWLYRTGIKYGPYPDSNGNIFLDFDTTKQDLIAYSIAHDTLFTEANGKIVVGAYSFQIPTNATIGDKYFIQLGSPSATSDGVGAPGAGIYIAPPPTNQVVTVGPPAYLVGDAAPFHWLNAGDFGDTNLDNPDVMQVYQSGVLGVDMPPVNSDLYFAMDSSGRFGVWDNVNHYYTDPGTSGDLSFNTQSNMWNGNDLSINTNAFGDGVLDVNDVFVTFRRSLDPSLLWFERYWTNGQFVAVTTPNLAFNTNIPSAFVSKSSDKLTPAFESDNGSQPPSVSFVAGDAQGSAGHIVQIPITANVFGSYPLRVLGLNLTVYPLDGSPDLTQPVQFTPAAGLGAPTSGFSTSKGNDTFAAAWLDSSISGVAGNATIGTLTITLPANATSMSAYAIHFNHASGSPNGLASFPKQTLTGLITLSSRTNSYYHDGIPDSWRLRWFGTVYNLLSVSNACPSGDGVNNWAKYVAGVDPNAPNDFPSLNSKTPVPSGATAAIHWPTVSGKQYVILRSSSLFPGSWTAIATNTGTGTDMEFDDNSTGTVKFYRVLILP